MTKRTPGSWAGRLCALSIISLATIGTTVPAATPLHSSTKSPTDNPAGYEPEMVLIPAGSSRVGSNSGANNEKPVHRVTLPAFEISKHEITRGQFAAFVAETGHITDAEKNSGGREGCYAYRGRSNFGWTRGMDWRFPGYDQDDNHPVVCVSHNDAIAYTEWLSNKTGKHYRLPSESQWEYVARAGSTDKYSFGNDEEELCLHSNSADTTLKERLPGWDWEAIACKDGTVYTAPVGSYLVNPYGLHDMHGNVWEWAGDCWHDTYEGAPRDGTARLTGNCRHHVVRGGAWDSDKSQLRPTSRSWMAVTARSYGLGFRVLRER
ncbi:MAG: formylglycine-generating enzyme family protein [Candidatus Sedimenticola sp. (ex Thyasira tokunagai)]